jgi:hypothetical protein
MQYAFHDYHPPAEDLLGEVLGGLTCLPCKSRVRRSPNTSDTTRC